MIDSEDDFLIGKGPVIARLTEGLVLVLDLGREERRRRHRLFYALHLVRLVADQASRDRIVALLYGA